MAKRKSILFLLLISSLRMVSSTSFSFFLTYADPGSAISSINPGKEDTFQNLLDQYCEIRYSKRQVESKIISLTITKEDNDSIIPALAIERKKYVKTRNRLIFRAKNGLGFFSGDSRRNRKSGKRKSGIKLYDSLIYNLDQRVSLLKKQNIEIDYEIESLQTELIKHNIHFENNLRKIRKYAALIRDSLSFSLCGVHYTIFVANLDSEEVRIHLFRKNGENFSRLDSVYAYLESQNMKPLMVTNAGMFTQSHEPEGLYIEEGSNVQYKLNRTKKNIEANFYLYPNGVFFIDSNNIPHVETTENFFKLQSTNRLKIRMATQSGPMILINGAIHPKFRLGSPNLKTRSGVGKINNSKVVFALTLDESNFYDFACFFKDIFNCNDALFLDGAISQMYIKGSSTHTTKYNFGPIISVSKKH